MTHTNNSSDISVLNNTDTLFQCQAEILTKVNETVYSVKEALKKSNVVLNSANETLKKNDRMTGHTK